MTMTMIGSNLPPRLIAPDLSLRWRAWIDWDGGGAWDESGADVSADVLALRWQWGRRGLPAPEFADPAQLELTLRNQDHRYTPGNTAGPLGSNVGPGRAAWLRVSRVHDDFADSGGMPRNLDGRATSARDVLWQVSSAPGNGFVVSDGIAMGEGGGWPPSDAVALLDTGDALATLSARFRRGSGGLGGFALRCAARDDCLRLRFANDATILERVSGRTVTRLSDGAALEVGAWYDLEIEQTAGSVRVYATGLGQSNLGQSNAGRREILAATGIAGAPDSGRHGLWHGFRNAQDRWAEFGVGRSLFTGHVIAVDPDHEAGVCRITAADVMQRLRDVPLHRALAGGLMRSGGVAAAVLGWSGLLPGDYVLDAGRLLLTGGPRSVWDVSADRALRRLQREEHGLIYSDGLGRVRMEAATRRADVRGHANPASAARFSIGGGAGSGPYATELRRNDGADRVEDSVTFRYFRPADAGRQQVWSLNEAMAIPAGGELKLLAVTDTWDVIEGINSPAAGTDYTATDDAAGSGTNVTGDVTVEALTEAESGIAGRGHALRISNSGGGTAYLQTLTLYADHCWRTQVSSAAPAESAAVALPPDTQRGRVIRCRYADNYAAAESAARARLAERSSQRSHLEVELPLLSAGNHAPVVEGRVSDVVELQAPTHGVTGAWFLEGMEVDVSGGGEGVARWWLTGV